MPQPAVDRRVIALAVGVPLTVLVLMVGLSLRDGGQGQPPDGDDTTSSTTAAGSEGPPPAIDEEWNDDLVTVVEPLGTVLTDLAATVDAWSTGAVDDEELDAVLDRVTPVVAAVRTAAGELAVHPQDPLARPLVVGMADLYGGAVEAHRFALATTGDLRTQYDHLGRRLRILADRLFDRARERTAAPVDAGPDVSFVLPAEVPDWERLEIAAGPPLVAVDPNQSDELPLGREDERPSQGEPAWQRDLAAIGAPSVDDVQAAAGDVDALDRLARGLVAAAEALRTVPVPDGDRGRADRVALGWLVRADAARAAQLLALGGPAVDGGERLVELLLDVSATAALAPR